MEYIHYFPYWVECNRRVLCWSGGCVSPQWCRRSPQSARFVSRRRAAGSGAAWWWWAQNFRLRRCSGDATDTYCIVSLVAIKVNVRQRCSLLCNDKKTRDASKTFVARASIQLRKARFLGCVCISWRRVHACVSLVDSFIFLCRMQFVAYAECHF